jgi:PAS domain S-box-containing protein
MGKRVPGPNDSKIHQSQVFENKDLCFRRLAEYADYGMLFLNADLKIIYQNPSAESTTRWNISKLKELNLFSLVHPVDSAVVAETLDHIAAQPRGKAKEKFKIRHYLGHYILLECSFNNLLEEPDVSAIMLTFPEGTNVADLEIKQDQSAMRNLPTTEALLDNLTDGFAAIDSKECYTYVNKRLAKMMGIDRETMIGRYMWDLFPGAIGSDTFLAIKKALRDKEYHCHEDYFEPLDLWQENRIYPTDEGLLIFIQDISARKKVDEKLRLSNERFSLIAKATHDALFEWDLLTHKIWWSESHYTMFGFNPAGPVPSQDEWMTRLEPEARNIFTSIVQSVLDGDLTQWEREITYHRPSGNWGTLLARGFVVFDVGKKPIKLLGSFIDISELRRAEIYRDLITDISNSFRVNENLPQIKEAVLASLLRFSRDKRGAIWLLSASGAEVVKITDGIEAPLAKGEDFEGRLWAENKLLTVEPGKLGLSLYHHEEFVGVLTLNLDKESNLIGLDESFWDTLSHQLGMELRHQQMAEQLKLLFDRAPDMIGIIGVDCFFKKVNPAMCNQLGYTNEELLSLPLDELVHPEDIINSRERTKAFITGGNQTMNFENRFLSKSGETISLSWTVTRAAEEGIMFCIGKNITDKKDMENLLHKANQLARIGGWQVDRVKGTTYWSPITREIYEVTEDFVPAIDNWLLFYMEGRDRDFIAGKMRDLIANGKPCDIEVQMVTARGNIRWVRAIAEAEFINGQCVRLYGSFQDIDNRKKAELAAVDASAERDKILESIGDGFFAVDNNWIVTYWNTAAEKSIGRSRDEMLGKFFWDKFPDVTELEFYRQYQKAKQSGHAVHFEDFYPHLQAWFSVSAYPSQNGLSVFFRNITESRAVIEELAESEKRYSDLFHLSPLPMFVYEMSTLRYLDVNLAALEHYGYTREEFLNMTVFDIRPAEDIPLVKKIVAEQQNQPKFRLDGVFRHLKKKR